MFDIDGRRITNLDQIMDGGIYICSSSKRFLPGKYGSYGSEGLNQINDSPPPRLASPESRGVPTTNLFRKNTVNSAPISSESTSDFGEKPSPIQGILEFQHWDHQGLLSIDIIIDMFKLFHIIIISSN